MNLFILTGARQSGKSRALKLLAEQLLLIYPTLKVGGVIEPVRIENNKLSGYDVLVLPHGYKDQLIYNRGEISGPILGRFVLNVQILEKVKNLFPPKEEYDLFILDEFGPLETKKEGWFELLSLASRAKIAIVCCRLSLVEEVKKLFPVQNVLVINTEDEPQKTVEVLLEKLKAYF